MPTVPEDVNLVSSWEEVDAAAQAIANGVQKSQMAQSVRTSLGKADEAWARLYWVTISRSGGSYTCDKTLAEIQSAQLAGAFVRAHLPDGFEADLTNDDGGAMFYSLDNSGGPMVLMRYTVAASGVYFASWPIGGSGSGLTEDIKQALLTCMAHVAWSDTHGQEYYDELEAALYPAPEPSTLSYITAAYEQDRPIYDTDDLDAIKVGDDLVVTAHYSNGTSVVLDDEDYTLSGTLTVGTSVITVTYEGKTATFNVTVTDDPVYGYVVVGSPSIENNILSPSSGSFIRSKRAFSPGNSAWRVQYGFTTGAVTSNQEYFGTVNASNEFVKELLNQHVYVSGANARTSLCTYASSDGSNWNICSATPYARVQANSTYLFEVEFTGTAYRARISTDNGATWGEYTSQTSPTKIVGGNYLAVGIAPFGNLFLGTFDLSTIKVWIDDVLWWQAVL